MAAAEPPGAPAEPASSFTSPQVPEKDGTAGPAGPAEGGAGSGAGEAQAFGLLFQAPEPTAAPRRRRATAPVQAPAERPSEPAEPAAPDRTEQPAERTEQDRASGPAEDDDDQGDSSRRRRRRGGRGRRGRGPGDGDDTGDAVESGPATEGGAAAAQGSDASGGAAGSEEASGRTSRRRGESPAAEDDSDTGSSRRRRRRRRSGSADDADSPPGTVTKVRAPRRERDEPTAVKGSTRLEAKKQRRREGREAGRRRTIITEAEFLARRESVERVMVVRGVGDRTQIGVLEDGVLVEHYVSRETTASMAGNIYLGRVQNVLPSMEAAFVDVGKGRNAVLYAGEVNWDAAGLDTNAPKRIENALSSGDSVLVQVTKDPIGHKGARLTSQISLPGRYLVYVPEGSMTGISRKLPDTERARLKAILKEVVPDTAGVIVRTAAEGAAEADLRADVERLTKTWAAIAAKAEAARAKKATAGGAPILLHGEPDLTVRVIRDVFTEDFTSLVVAGDTAWSQVSGYIEDVAPDLAPRVSRWTSEEDVFGHYRVHEQLAKAMDRKVWLPSGGSLVIDRTEAMTVIDVNTGKFVGSGGNLEETVTKNNIEAAEEIVRQLRLRDIGGIIVIDFIDMVLESNRDLVVRRLLECLGRDRTKHQVAEVTSLGLVQMTRKRVGSGLIEVFSEQCEHCNGRGIIVHAEPVAKNASGQSSGDGGTGNGGQRSRSRSRVEPARTEPVRTEAARTEAEGHSGPTPAQIAAAAHAAAIKSVSGEPIEDDVAALVSSAGGAFEEVVAVSVDADVADAAAQSAAADPPPAAADPDETDAATVGADQPVEPPSTPRAEVRTRRRRGRVVVPAGPPTPPRVGAVPRGRVRRPR